MNTEKENQESFETLSLVQYREALERARLAEDRCNMLQVEAEKVQEITESLRQVQAENELLRKQVATVKEGNVRLKDALNTQQITERAVLSAERAAYEFTIEKLVEQIRRLAER